MRLRTFLIAAGSGGRVRVPDQPAEFVGARHSGRISGPIWSGPTVAHSAGLGADETNNIEIYKAAEGKRRLYHQHHLPARFFLRRAGGAGLGSGFIINADGQILTNYHVISGSSDVEVTLPPDQSRYKAQSADARPGPRSRADSDRSQEEADLVPQAGRFRRLAGGAEGAGDRQSVRAGGHFDHGHRQFAAPQDSRRESKRHGGHDPDRRGHQFGQQRRSAARFARQRDRDQHRHLRSQRRQRRHRFRHAHQPRQGDAGGFPVRKAARRRARSACPPT